jgi:hypothetical protein
MKKRTPKEITIEDYGTQQFERAGGTHEKFKTPGRRNVPDRLCSLLAGIYFFIEYKRQGKKPRIGQLRDHARRRARGFKVFVVDTKAQVDRLVETKGESDR